MCPVHTVTTCHMRYMILAIPLIYYFSMAALLHPLLHIRLFELYICKCLYDPVSLNSLLPTCIRGYLSYTSVSVYMTLCPWTLCCPVTRVTIQHWVIHLWASRTSLVSLNSWYQILHHRDGVQFLWYGRCVFKHVRSRPCAMCVTTQCSSIHIDGSVIHQSHGVPVLSVIHQMVSLNCSMSKLIYDWSSCINSNCWWHTRVMSAYQYRSCSSMIYTSESFHKQWSS